MSCTIDDIREANPTREGVSISRIDALLQQGAVSEHFVCSIVDEIERRETPHIAAFFQLPQPISSSREWISVPALEAGLAGEVYFEPHVLTMGDLGQSVVVTPVSELQVNRKGYPVTQAAILFPYWGVRAKYFSIYESAFREYRLEDRIVVPQKHSWHQNRPIRASDFEVLLEGRLIREIKSILRSILPAFSMASRCEISLPEWLYNYFIMPLPGRIVRPSKTISTLAYVVNSSNRARTLPTPSFQSVQEALFVRFREFSIFENQLFAMNTLLDEGELSSAQIGTIGLMEWMIRQFVGLDTTAKSPFAVVIKDEGLDDLPAELLKNIRSERMIRNQLVHGRPLERLSFSIEGSRSERGKQIERSDHQVTYASVKKLIDDAFELYRAMNKRKPKFWA